MAKKALIVVDVQNDFCPGGALAVADGDQVVGPLKKVLDYAAEHSWLIVFSRDWHPRDSKHFSEHGGKWPTHCIQRTAGANFHPGLKVADYTGVVISKGEDPEDDGGYSAFEGYIGEHDEDGLYIAVPLRRILVREGVSEVYVGGLATDYCVKATALDAVRRGFKTFLLADACRAVNLTSGDGDRAIAEMVEAGVRVTNTVAAVASNG